MKVSCVWEHNGSDSLLYCASLPGAFTRGAGLEDCIQKMEQECKSFLKWKGESAPEKISVEIIQEASCELEIRDADSDVLFEEEKLPLSMEEYRTLRSLALKSAEDFLTLYTSIPDPKQRLSALRRTFYGQVPGTAEEMYIHTKNVNAYYFSEIEVDADNAGNILECRCRGFSLLEKQPDFLSNRIFDGSYGEAWTLRKVLRRFIWHDRIHAKALYRQAVCVFGTDKIPNSFCFQID